LRDTTLGAVLAVVLGCAAPVLAQDVLWSGTMTVGHDPAPCDACGPFYGYSSGESNQLGLILGELGNVSAPAGFTVSGLVVRTSVDSDSADIVLTLERVEQRDTSAWSLTVGGRELSFVDAYHYLDEDNGSHAAFWWGNPGWQVGEELAVSVVAPTTEVPAVSGVWLGVGALLLVLARRRRVGRGRRR